MPNDEAVWPADAIEVGRVMDAWGIKGGIKVQPFSSDPQALFSSRRWFIAPPAQLPKAAGAHWPSLLHVTEAREQGGLVVATCRELPDRTAAEGLRGARVYVSRQSFPTAGDGEYYWIDLIGLDVINREGVSLGTVAGLIDTGPHCVLKVAPGASAAESAPDASPERLIPFVDAYVDAVSLTERRITVDWGLDY